MRPLHLLSIVPRLYLLLFVVALGLPTAASAAGPDFINFESGQVRPLAMSPDGTKLFVVNTSDNRLEIFDVVAGGLTHSDVVPVGMEPVAVAARSNTEVWVVNHLSDSVSIISLTGTPVVTRTLLVGDEPRDIVFAGTGGNRAFITTAHRGQHRTHTSISGVTGAGDPNFITAGEPRADVWVFDATSLGTTIGGTPLEIVELFGDTPRALAVTPDGNTVYAAVFHSGNQTTVVSEIAVCDGFDSAGSCNVGGETMPGGNPGPDESVAGDPAPEVGLIVRYDNGQARWVDEDDRDWSDYVQFNLPDNDVFEINANTLAHSVKASQVGTILFNMAVHPTNGRLYVSNTESPNEVRFEGPGTASTTVRGHVSEARVTVVDGSTVTPRHLNKHINYATLPAPVGTANHSLATPVGMEITADGLTMYVSAFGSSKIGVVPTANLDSNWAGFDPTVASANYVTVTGGGPSGLVLDERMAWRRMYVLTRFDNSVSVVDLDTGLETSHLSMATPEPAVVLDGRHVLYDAAATSSNGEASCSSCHIFGDNDNLAWDLGDPDGDVLTNPMPINLGPALVLSGQVPPDLNGSGEIDEFHPMKGPMTTQTLRGMVNSGAMHWRGDRSQPGNFPFDELENFKNFRGAFVGLVGRATQIPTGDMDDFAEFALTIMLPPNPVRNLDNTLTPDQQAGSDFYHGPRRSDGLAADVGAVVTGFTCEGCHTLNPIQGFFGTNGNTSFEAESQIIKTPHLRNLYTKVGMFGGLDLPGIRPLNLPHQGDQIRGFGFNHDGAADTAFRFLNADVFEEDFAGPGVGFDGPQDGDVKRRQMEQFLLAFDTDLSPMVGQQVTLDATNFAEVGSRITEMEVQADTNINVASLNGVARACNLIVKGVVGGVPRTWLYLNGNYAQGNGMGPVTPAVLKALPATESPLTFTCAPPGSGVRMGLDRDLDAIFDEVDNCPDVANALQENEDGDLDGDACDSDDDNDGVLDGPDTDDLDPLLCADVDADSCDDCAVGVDGFGPLADNDPANDGLDTDSDQACDLSDSDDDNDGILDGSDTDDLDPNVCADADLDNCDDCAVGVDGFGVLADNDTANDGTDTDGDLACDFGDGDDDNDGILDGPDTDDLNPNLCADADLDSCDDCAIGVDGFGLLADNTPANDGTDTDGDLACDFGDTDDDNDGVADGPDTNDVNPSICADADLDGCDDCAVGVDGFGVLADNDTANDGTDTDGDLACDAGDADDDNDGILDGPDTDDLNPNVCADADADSCDDCAIGVDGFGALADNNTSNDGLDTDGDLQCNVGDPDDDGDTLLDTVETDTGIYIGPGDTGTDPLLVDTDGDGFDDPFEVLKGSDPNDSQSTPVFNVPVLSPLAWLLLTGLLGGAGARTLRRRD